MSIYDGWTGDRSIDFTTIGDDGTEIAWYGDEYGLQECHYVDGVRHSGSVPTSARSATRWTIESGEYGNVEGLTLSPSIACNHEGCTHHGWIRDGKWVSV